MKAILLFLALVLAGCAGGFKFGPRGFTTISGLEETTPTPSPCDVDLSLVPAGKQKLAADMVKLIGDPALSESDRRELKNCLCDFLRNLSER